MPGIQNLNSNIAIMGYHEDIRGSISPDEQDRLAHALLVRLPYPHGVVPERAKREFFRVLREKGTRLAEEVANCCAHGPVIDALVILLRLVLASGLTSKHSREPVLFDLAFHDFGRTVVNDYIIKGSILDMLYPPDPTRSGRIEPTLGELLRHQLITRALWHHPCMHFWRRDTWIKKKDSPYWEPHKLDALLPSQFPFSFQANHDTDLGKYLSGKFGLRENSTTGEIIVFAANFPLFIPVIIKGNRKFDTLRSFELTGVEYQRTADKSVLQCITTKRRQYHLRAVINLAESDIHTYHQDTTPVEEQLWVGDDRTGDYKLKLERGTFVGPWTLEEKPMLRFMLLYAKYSNPSDGAYEPPCRKYGEVVAK